MRRGLLIHQHCQFVCPNKCHTLALSFLHTNQRVLLVAGFCIKWTRPESSFFLLGQYSIIVIGRCGAKLIASHTTAVLNNSFIR